MNWIYRKTRWAALPLAMLLPLSAQIAKKGPAAQQAQAAQPGITREQADEILKELRQIRELLEKQADRGAPAGPPRARLNLEGFQMLGDRNAPITVVEFTDYQCPFCRQFHVTVFNDLKKNFIDTGKVRFFSRDLPLDALHPNAIRAAQAGRCAADQGQFWKLRDVMGANPDKLDQDSLVADATNLGMDVSAFRTCLTSQKYKEAVQTDVMEAMKIGAEATPTFVVGKSTPTGVDGELLIGAEPLSKFVQVFAKIEAAK